MSHFKRPRSHKGYGKPGLFSASSTSLRFSKRTLLLALALMIAGIWLVTWGLFYLQAKP